MRYSFCYIFTMAHWFQVFVATLLLGGSSAIVIMEKEYPDYDDEIYEELIIGLRRPKSHSLKHSIQDVIPQSEHENGCFSLKTVMRRITITLMSTKRDPHYLVDETFSLPSENSVLSGSNKVTLNKGRFFGMSDFEVLQSNLSDYLSDFWFSWSHMRAIYDIGIDDVDGETYAGNCEVDLGPLLMHVKLLCSNTKSPKIEMSEVGDVKDFKMTGLEAVPTEMRKATEFQVKTSIMTYTNNKVRFQLRNYVKLILSELAVKTKRSANRLKYL